MRNIACITNNTFPKTGAIPMMTEAKAERTCCDESDDSSCNCSQHALVQQVKEAHK
jgi:hypothetical protein